MSKETKDYAIEILTRLLIETDFYEKKKNVKVYVSKKDLCRNLIKLFKEYL